MSPELKTALERIRKRRVVSDPICRLLGADALQNEFLELIKAWPKFSGNATFPIPHPHMDPRAAFIATDDMWAGTYGENRLEAVNWLLGTKTYAPVAEVAKKLPPPTKIYAIPKL